MSQFACISSLVKAVATGVTVVPETGNTALVVQHCCTSECFQLQIVHVLCNLMIATQAINRCFVDILAWYALQNLF